MKGKFRLQIITIIFIWIFNYKAVYAAISINLDGEYTDWVDKPTLEDNINDSEASWLDFTQVKWYPDEEKENLYLYCSRKDSGRNSWSALSWDFEISIVSGNTSKYAYISYTPNNKMVRVYLYDEFNRFLWSGKGKWGAHKQNGTEVEFYLPLTHCVGSVAGGYELNMVFSGGGDRVPEKDSIIISSINTLPFMGVLLLGLMPIINYKIKER